MTLLVCFGGQIGSGKSSVSTAVAEAFGWRRTGFGDYLRAEVERRGGDPTRREALQDLGQQLVDTDADAFCKVVLSDGGFKPRDNFIIDGVRHVEIFRVLSRIALPSTARLFFLSANETYRSHRISVRSDKGDFARAAMHRVEAELQNDLPSVADVVVDATRSFDEVVADCLASIRIWREL